MDDVLDTKTPVPKSRPGEIYFLIALLGLFGVILSQALQLNGLWQRVAAGPGSLPQMFSAFALLLLLGVSVSVLKASGAGGISVLGFLFSRDVVVLLASVLVYGLLLDFVGFVVSTFFFLFATMYMLDKKKPIRTAIVALGLVVCILVIFRMLFEVVLP